MTTWARLVGGYRVAFAALTAVALGWQAHLVVAQGRRLDNFFSYFTIESNILATVALAWGGVTLLAGRRTVPDVLRGAVVVYLAVTGIVYATLLANLPGQSIEPWVNTVVHRVTPIVLVVDWLVAPREGAPRLRRTWWWLAFPLLYLAYTSLRGPFADWYPYPFLDPRPHGYGQVIVGVVAIAVGFVVVTVAVRWVGVVLGRRAVAPSVGVTGP
jgi:hypothetical protein